MKLFDTIMADLTAKLTEEQLQLLKDTIKYGFWGDCDMAFAPKGGEPKDFYAYGYCTNDARRAGHFSGRKCSAMFRSMYKRLGILGKGGGMGEYFAYCNDWWGDGTGDMFFIRNEREGEEWLCDKFENWAISL